MKEILLSLVLLPAACSVLLAADDAEASRTGLWTIELEVEGTITDTRYIPHPMLFAKPSLQGVVMTVDSCTTKDGDEVPALVLKALRQANQKVEGTVTWHQQLIDVLGEHRRPLGIGVHGPLRAKGRMFLVIVPEEGDRLRVSMSMQPTEVTGPRGSWTARD